MKLSKSLSCLLCLLLLSSCVKENMKDSEPVKAEPLTIINTPTAIAKKVLDTEMLNMEDHVYLMAQYVENDELYFSAVNQGDNHVVNSLCKYNLKENTFEVLKEFEGNYVINSFVFTGDSLIFSKLDNALDESGYHRFTVMMENEEGIREIDQGLTTDWVGYDVKMHSPQLIKMGQKVFYATEDYTHDYENDVAYNARFVMLDENGRTDLISESAHAEDFMGVYYAYDKIFSYGNQLAIIIKQSLDTTQVTYENDIKVSEKYTYSNDNQNVYIYDENSGELNLYKNYEEVEFSGFVDENTLYAVDTSIKIANDLLFDINSGEFIPIENVGYAYGYTLIDSWAEDKLIAHYDKVVHNENHEASYAILTIKDGRVMSGEVAFDELPQTQSRIIVVNDEEVLVHTRDGLWLVSETMN